MSEFGFRNRRQGWAARSGILRMERGAVLNRVHAGRNRATVKAMLPESVAETGADIVLANTYHLMLRPGAERSLARRLAQIHELPWPILTDSGGYQVMCSRLAQDDGGRRAFRRISTLEHFLSPRCDGNPAFARLRILWLLDECAPLSGERR